MNRRAAAAASCAAALLVLAMLGCDTAPRTPTETVDLYFRTLGRDPGRALSLFADDFHTTHGLTIANLEGWGWGAYENIETVERVDPSLAPLDAERGLDSAQTAWLLVQADPTFQAIAANLEVAMGEERVEERTARVITAVRLHTGDAFRVSREFAQIFHLTRTDPAAPWRISSISQKRVAFEDTYASFVAYPAEASRRVVAEHIPPRHAGEGRRDVAPVTEPSGKQ